MYALNLYVFHRKSDNFHALVYGFAIDVGEDEPIAWYQRKINDTRSWELLCLWCILNGEFLGQFIEKTLSTGKIEVKDQQIVVPRWELRPAIYLAGRQEHVTGLKSLTYRTARGRIYYALGKTSYLERLFPPGNMERDKVKDALRKLEDWVAGSTGVKLLSEDSDRFGNLEIYDNLDAGCLLEPFGLHVELIKDMRTHPDKWWQQQPVSRGVKIWADETLEKSLPLWVNVSLYNGRSHAQTLLADELKQLQRAGDVVTCEGAEPITSLAVKVWSGQGKLLHYSHSYLIRSLHFDLKLLTGVRYIKDPWSEKLPQKYRDRAESVTTTFRQVINTGGYPFDPWVAEGELFRSTLAALFPQSSRSRFFVGSQDGEVMFFEYLQSLLSRPEVKKATFVDPYFDTGAAARILPRLQNLSLPVEVITSLVDKQVSDSEKAVSPEGMRQVLRQNISLLPPNLKVINVQNEQATEQQFHDRFLLLETKGGIEGWILGNSFNSQSRRYPAVMVELPADVLEKVEEYVEGLRAGNVPGREEARSVVLWDAEGVKRQSQEEKPEALPGNLRAFPGWEDILCFFPVSGADARDALRQIIELGYLETSGEAASWRVREDKREEVFSQIRDYTKQLFAAENPDGDKVDALFSCLAHWIYCGAGFTAEDVIVRSERAVAYLQRFLENLRREISNSINAKELQWAQLKTVYENFSEEPESYRQCWGLGQNPWEFDHLLREKVFYAEYLQKADPHRYCEELDRNWVLLPHLFHVLHWEEISNDYFQSKVATRFILFHLLNFRPVAASTQEAWQAVPAAGEWKVKVFLTHLSMQGIEEQQNLLPEVPTLLDQAVLSDDEILPFLTGLKQGVAALLSDLLDATRPGLAGSMRRQVLERWVEKLKGEKLYFNYSLDQPETENMVDVTCKLYGTGWTDWYVKQFLNGFPWKKYRDPLYRFADYSHWYADSLRLLWSLFLGLTYLVDKVSGQGDAEEKTWVLNEIVNRFEQYLVPHVWQLAQDEILLDEVLYLMGWLADQAGADNLCEKCLCLVEDRRVHLPRKLVMYLSTYKLFEKRKKEVFEVLESPVLALWLSEKARHKLDWIADALGSLADKAPDQDREILSSMRSKVLRIRSEGV
ncbi:hypothetical protein SAMN02745218_00648 [Desulfofundulus australicus DSM 11792]|uniref:Uncharacterized protein n=1 Tax=Desulfofundulus australicus DSM 11792 TaxID=1121425 RepID=A0A1M4VF72_9FIRM|nr:VPA1262 family protein [Desulfofundulus australicus]SHE67601.1 hypothetical protein SAMN02745218_00648 [Desulfofundulus australicus DSM 11792]